MEVANDWEGRRFQKMHKAMGIVDPLEMHEIYILNARNIDIGNPILSIGNIVEEQKPRLVIIDPFYALHMEDENDQKAMKNILKKLYELCRKHKCAILVVHHDAKGKPGDREKIDRGSGSGVMGRFSDTRIILTPHADDDDAVCVDTVTRNYKPIPSFTAKFENECFIEVPDMEPKAVTSRRPRSTAIEAAKAHEDALCATAKAIAANKKAFSISEVRDMIKDYGVRNNNMTAKLATQLCKWISDSDERACGVRFVKGIGRRGTFYGPLCTEEPTPTGLPYADN